MSNVHYETRWILQPLNAEGLAAAGAHGNREHGLEITDHSDLSNRGQRWRSVFMSDGRPAIFGIAACGFDSYLD